ncbi:MHYT domain-containing protein, partial [Klebsiella variicola]|uniref:MHYT domain-containing protein n=2 Tax=Klebsiella variicola TaxID=244366 RepID=UPI003527E72D
MVLNNFNPILTAMSLMISIISAWTALDMASRVTKSQGIAARLWLIGGGIAMGTGVWAMHFVGMQAMVPVIGIRYNL